MNRFAVIDLGTNTFHLLIVERNGQSFSELHRERRFVKLAEEGIQRIGEVPFQRAVATMLDYKNILARFEVKNVQAFGTAALRTADNGNQLQEEIKACTGIPVQLISGGQEAALIHKGVAQAFPIGVENVLIMDIGGGSVEFIIANQSAVLWAESFPIGVAVLFNQFHKSDPIHASEINRLRIFLENTLLPLQKAIQANKHIKYLIGASGTFDVLAANIEATEKGTHHTKLPVREVIAYHQQLLRTTLAERLNMSKLPQARAQLIVVALILIDAVLGKIIPQEVVVSEFAMKEGMLQEMMSGLNS